MEWLINLTGGGGILNPMIESPWGTLVTLALGLAVGFWIGRRTKGAE